MGENAAPRATEMDERRYVAIADLVRWMAAQKRAPGSRLKPWTHRSVRAQLERELGMHAIQPHGPRGKIYYRADELERCAPLLFKSFFASKAEAARDSSAPAT